MTNKNLYDQHYDTWQQVWFDRCCPPEKILYGKKTEELSAHLAICPQCQDSIKQYKKEHNQQLQEYGKLLLNTVDTGQEVEQPAPGQLWTVHHDLGKWGPKNRYYQPPIVLILSTDNNSVLVSQIHDYADFKAKGDIRLYKDENDFAEAWNCYTLKTENLASCWGNIDKKVVNEIIENSDLDDHEVDNESLIALFRQLEIETGFYFSSQAVSSLMEDYETTGVNRKKAEIIPFPYAKPDPIIRQILQEHSFKVSDEDAENNMIMLLHSSYSEPIRLAADESMDGNYINGPLLTINDRGQDTALLTHGSVQINYSPADKRLEVEGGFQNVNFEPGNVQLALGWLCENGELIITSDFDYYPEDNSFDAVFENVPSDKGELRFFLVDVEFLKDE